MAIKTTVRLSELEFGNRIDGELYNPSLKMTFQKLFKSNFQLKKLRQTCIIKSGTTPRDRDDNLDSGPILFKTTDIRNSVLNPFGNYYHINTSIHDRMSTTKLSANDVLLNIVGASLDVIGRSGIILHYFEEANITQAMVLLRIKKELTPGYLFTFLNTKFAQDQIKRYARPTGQFNLNLNEVGHILIPILSQEIQIEVHKLILKSGELQYLSQSLYKQASDLLIKSLGLDKIIFQNPKSYTATFSEVISNSRNDADFFQTKYRQLEIHISKVQSVALATICTFLKGYEVGTSAYTTKGPTFLRVSNLTKEGFKFGNSDKHISLNTFTTLKLFQPKIGDILLTKDGTIGTCYVVDENVEGIISSGIMNLKLTDYSVPKEYLALVINSKICKMQAERECSGALITHWKPEQIRKLRIPILDKEVMGEIADLVSQSKFARKKSVQLLGDAKARVEQLIEEAANKL